jgi:rubrerythrin
MDDDFEADRLDELEEHAHQNQNDPELTTGLCPECGGTGYVNDIDDDLCPVCGGDGGALPREVAED